MKYLKTFNEANMVPDYDIHDRDQFDAITNIAKDEGLQVERVFFAAMVMNREVWTFYITDYDNIMQEKQFAGLVDNICDRLDNLYYNTTVIIGKDSEFDHGEYQLARFRVTLERTGPPSTNSLFKMFKKESRNYKKKITNQRIGTNMV